MASFENLMTMEPWGFRSADSWFSDVFTRETETLTKLLQQSVVPAPVQTSTGSGSGSGGSENETTGSNRRGKGGAVSSKKITKRKSRASRRNTTTYITADVDNFRHMVQQVTGVQFREAGHLPVVPLLKPEPQRVVSNRLQQVAGGGCLPTLDTSAFLLDQPQLVGPAPVADGGSRGFDFGSFTAFPTLESCNAAGPFM